MQCGMIPIHLASTRVAGKMKHQSLLKATNWNCNFLSSIIRPLDNFETGKIEFWIWLDAQVHHPEVLSRYKRFRIIFWCSIFPATRVASYFPPYVQCGMIPYPLTRALTTYSQSCVQPGMIPILSSSFLCSFSWSQLPPACSVSTYLRRAKFYSPPIVPARSEQRCSFG